MSRLTLRRDLSRELSITELDNNFDFLDNQCLVNTQLGNNNSTAISTLNLRMTQLEEAVDFDGSFNSLSNIPTTLNGYGITDAATTAQGALAETALQPTDDIPFGNISNIPTTLTGYGITDAASQQYADTIQSNVSELLDRIIVCEDRLGINTTPRITIESSVNEISETVDETTNKVVTFTVNAIDFLTDNATIGTVADTHTYTISGVGITEDDFIDTPLSGTIGTGNGTFEITVTVARDEETESATEIMEFAVSTTSTNPNKQLPSPLQVTINDTSFDSTLRVVNYDPAINGDLFTWLKTNALTAYITDIDDGYLLTPTETAQAQEDAKTNVSRASLVSLGISSSDIDTLVDEVIQEIVDVWNASIQGFFQNTAFVTHNYNYAYGTEQQDTEIGTFIQDPLNINRKFGKGSLAHSEVVYVESYTQNEVNTMIDDFLATDSTYNSLTASDQITLRDFLIACSAFVLAILPGTETTISLYNYREVNELN